MTTAEPTVKDAQAEDSAGEDALAGVVRAARHAEILAVKTRGVLLGQVRDAKRRQAEAEADQVLLVAALCEAYADTETAPDEVLGEQVIPGSRDGLPEVAESLGHELGPVLGVSVDSAWSLIWDVLSLRHRHPVLWDLTVSLQVPVWRARRVASVCGDLSFEQARQLDSELGPRMPGWGPVTTLNQVKRAIVRLDPAAEAARQASKRSRSVWFAPHPGAPGISDLVARLDAGDALHLDGTLNHLADALAQAGATHHTRDELRAIALGHLAHPAHAAHLLATGTTGTGGAGPAGAPGAAGTPGATGAAGTPGTAGAAAEAAGPAGTPGVDPTSPTGTTGAAGFTRAADPTPSTPDPTHSAGRSGPAAPDPTAARTNTADPTGTAGPTAGAAGTGSEATGAGGQATIPTADTGNVATPAPETPTPGHHPGPGHHPPGTPTPDGSSPRGSGRVGCRHGAELIVHLTRADLASTTSGGEAAGIGPLTRAHLTDLLAGCTGTVTVRPVVDLAAPLAVARYRPSAEITWRVTTRDHREAYPYSERSATSTRVDLDHTTPYNHDDPAAGGPTCTSNLATVSRRTHRLKTHAGFQADQPSPGVLRWTTPTGHTYWTTPHGTWPHPPPDTVGN